MTSINSEKPAQDSCGYVEVTTIDHPEVIMKVEMRNEILFKAPTRVGLLADVCDALGAKGVNILAIGAYDKGGDGEFLLLTSNNRDASEALLALGGTVDFVPVVWAEMPNEPGALAKIARRIAEHGINVSQIHATTADAPTAGVVLRTDCEIDVIKMLGDL